MATRQTPGRIQRRTRERLPLLAPTDAAPPFASYGYQDDPTKRQPTAAYSAFFLLCWVPAVLAVPASLALLGVGVGWAVQDGGAVARYAVAFGVAGALALYTILMRTHSPRVLIRAGAFPALCMGDATPTTEAELRECVRKIVARTGKPPTVVGSGWGYFLTRTGATGRRLFLHNFKGKQPSAPERWRSGTTIAAVANALLKEEGLTFASHPTMEYITMGSWFALGNHGNTGDLSKGSSKSLKTARVLDMTTDAVQVMEYPQIRRLFDGVGGDDPSKYVILDVTLQNLVQNDRVQKRGIVIDSPEKAAAWLAPGAYLRVCFQGAARSYALGARWEDVYDNQEEHKDPHLCSRFCTFAQMDLLSVWGGWHEPMSRYTGLVDRYDANRWVAAIYPLATIAIVLSGIRNFEIVFRLDQALDGNLLYRLSQELISIHKEIGGRSEIRSSKSRSTSPVFLDCAVARGSERIFALLRARFGVVKCALHPGKHTALSTSPLERVSLAEVYGMFLPS